MGKHPVLKLFESLQLSLRDVGGSVVDGVGDVVHVLGGQSTHVDTARLDQVDVILLAQMVNLLYCKEKKGKVCQLNPGYTIRLNLAQLS